MKYLHTMVRVSDLDASLDFFCNKLGLTEVERYDYPENRFTLVMLAAPDVQMLYFRVKAKVSNRSKVAESRRSADEM